jgi:hypothetical protein
MVPRGACNIRKHDLAAALKAVKEAGLLDKVEKVEIAPGGAVTITMKDNTRTQLCGRAATGNEWDEVFNDDGKE